MAHRTAGRAFAALITLALIVPSLGLAFPADFFDADASGNATYEAFVIQPEAVYDPGAGAAGVTYVIYQGLYLEPYISTYDHATQTWAGPVRIGDNSLLASADLHGGPSLIVDDAGYLHAFYGAHQSRIRHSRSTAPHDASSWEYLGSVKTGTLKYQGTYPQPMMMSDGSMRLFFRRSQLYQLNGRNAGGEFHLVWGSVATTNPSDPSGVTWDTFESAIYGSQDDTSTGSIETDRYYVCFSKGVTDTIHAAYLRQPWDYTKTTWTEPYGGSWWRRFDVYYAERSATGTWTTAAGASLEETRAHERNTPALVVDSGDEFVNQVVVRDDGEGSPFVTYLANLGRFNEYRWARWTGSAWTTGSVGVTTDHFFDAVDASASSSQTIDLYLARGEEPAATAGLDEARGGHMERWRTTNGGVDWSFDTTILASPGPAHIYNNPQVVQAGGSGPQVAFSEWNMDASSFIHKVYLWGTPGAWSANGFAQRTFTPDVERIYGPTRVDTAVRASKETFPNGADTVLVANRDSFPDALCGVPLAAALDAPILLVPGHDAPGVVMNEIERLGADEAIILGGESVVTTTVASELDAAGLSVSRLQGQTRYETAEAIAGALRAETGAPGTVVVASGESFPDALCISPTAARRGWPIVLVPRSGLPTDTVDAVNASGASASLFVGGSAAIGEGVRASLIARTGLSAGQVTRIEGSDRYETAYEATLFALDQGLELERFVLATGENFADALTGGVLAERMGGAILITRPHELSAWTRKSLVDGGAWNVLKAYVMGGEAAIEPVSENALAAVLLHRQDPD